MLNSTRKLISSQFYSNYYFNHFYGTHLKINYKFINTLVLADNNELITLNTISAAQKLNSEISCLVLDDNAKKVIYYNLINIFRKVKL